VCACMCLVRGQTNRLWLPHTSGSTEVQTCTAVPAPTSPRASLVVVGHKWQAVTQWQTQGTQQCQGFE
jgi:hypothetical protein